MKLRIQINQLISRVELTGEEPTLADLKLQVQEILLPSHGLRPEFTLSLNGTEPLVVVDTVLQTLSSCGIVSGDLIRVLLSTASPSAQSGSSSAFSSRTPSQQHSQINLCSEAEVGKVPRSLEVLHRGAQSSSPADCLMVAVHLLMWETGFVPHGYSDVVKPGGETMMMMMPTGWRKAGGAYRLHYAHPLCEDSLVMLNAVSMGAKLVINATLKIKTADTTTTTTTTVVKLSDFVSAEWAGSSAATVFKDLPSLSQTFKDELAFPLISAAKDPMALGYYG